MSNREIADVIGVTEAAVRRRLSRAVDAISNYIERGRTFERRAFYALTLWLCGRWVGGATPHVVQAAMVVSAAAVIVAQPPASVRETPELPQAHSVPHPAAPVFNAAPATRDQVAPPRPAPSITDTNPQIPNVGFPAVQIPKVELPSGVPPLPATPPARGVLPI
jgi:hypothetical protein